MNDLREKIARYVIHAVESSLRVDEATEAIVSAVRSHATSDEAVRRMERSFQESDIEDEYENYRAAILAVL